jgi:predicted enzyme related to lactoylglutathione lyase
MNEVLTWVEIPSADFERALHFYSTIFGSTIPADEFMGVPHGFLRDQQGTRRGAVIPNTDANLYEGGPLVYIRVENLDDVVARVAAAGGSVLRPKTIIGPQGAIAIIRDTEGNRVGLHSVAV